MMGIFGNNQESYDNPKPGDYWQEMFCPYFVVLDVLNDDTFIICEAKLDVSPDKWTWDLKKSIQVEKKYFKRVKYSSIEGFCAYVIPNENWAVEKWKEMGSPYRAIVPPFGGPADFRTVMEQGI